jgi:hypothetical protein
MLYAEGSSLSQGQARKILHHGHPPLTAISLEQFTSTSAQDFLNEHWNVLSTNLNTSLKPLPTWNLMVIYQTGKRLFLKY